MRSNEENGYSGSETVCGSPVVPAHHDDQAPEAVNCSVSPSESDEMILSPVQFPGSPILAGFIGNTQIIGTRSPDDASNKPAFQLTGFSGLNSDSDSDRDFNISSHHLIKSKSGASSPQSISEPGSSDGIDDPSIVVDEDKDIGDDDDEDQDAIRKSFGQRPFVMKSKPERDFKVSVDWSRVE